MAKKAKPAAEIVYEVVGGKLVPVLVPQKDKRPPLDIKTLSKVVTNSPAFYGHDYEMEDA